MILTKIGMFIDKVVIRYILAGNENPWLDPMRILDSEDEPKKRNFTAKYYGIVELFDILKTGFTVVCVCAVLVSLIALLFVNKAEMVADKKANIMHKLGIVFIISSFVTLLNIISAFVKIVLDIGIVS